MANRARNHDGNAIVLALATLALTLTGLVAVYSATAMEAVSVGGLVSDALRNQALFALVGTAAGYAAYRLVPVRLWAGRATWALWAAAVVLLAATAAFGTEALGAKRWLSIGSFSFQPSELMKAAFVVMAAKVVEERRCGALSERGMWAALALRVGVPVLAMLYAQSDLGTTMVCLVGVMAALWLGGVPGRQVLALAIGCLALGAVAVVTSPYRLERFRVTFDPWSDGQGGYGSGYQLIHSLYALATGGVTGVGVGGSSEKYGSLPEADTDFIFAVIGEECGLVGCAAVIALFLVFLWAGLRISDRAATPFGASLSGALAVALVFQAFLNIASVIGAFPMTGKPLPFVSYGGSSLVMSLVMAGLVASATREGTPSDRLARRRRDELVVVRPSRRPDVDVRGPASGRSASRRASGPQVSGGRRAPGRNQRTRGRKGHRMSDLGINAQGGTKIEGMVMGKENTLLHAVVLYGLALAAVLCAALWLSAFAGVGDAEAKTYPVAEKKIEAAVSKGRTWVDFGSTRIPWQDACKAFQKVKCKKAGYIVKAKECQTWRYSGSPYACKMKVSYRGAAQRKALNAKAKAMMKKVSRWDSQLEKAEKIHDAIIKRSSYDYTSYYSGKLREDSGSAYGNLVRSRSVCAGYAEAFQLVALKAGLKSRYVCNGSHAWNLVRVGGKWYHIDVCWDDTGGSKRKYFLKGSKTMAKVKSHGIKDCYPSKVSVSKGDYVVKAPPVEVVDDEAGKADSSKGDLTAGTPAGGTAVGRPSEGSTGKTGGAPASAVKDPSKGVNAGKNDASGPGEYTGGGAGGLSTKDPSASPATTGNAPIGAGSSWAGPSN